MPGKTWILASRERKGREEGSAEEGERKGDRKRER